MASRLRNWSESIDALDDYQNGFRGGRSTADSVQIIIKINEETALYKEEMVTPDDPVATLLDITKALPRINRPTLWGILERYGMKQTTLTTLKGLHD